MSTKKQLRNKIRQAAVFLQEKKLDTDASDKSFQRGEHLISHLPVFVYGFVSQAQMGATEFGNKNTFVYLVLMHPSSNDLPTKQWNTAHNHFLICTNSPPLVHIALPSFASFFHTFFQCTLWFWMHWFPILLSLLSQSATLFYFNHHLCGVGGWETALKGVWTEVCGCSLHWSVNYNSLLLHRYVMVSAKDSAELIQGFVDLQSYHSRQIYAHPATVKALFRGDLPVISS